MEKHHFEQARLWLVGAQHLFQYTTEGSDKYAVAVAMAVHAILKANDALTYKFMNMTARRHDEARRLFEDLIKSNLVPAGYASYKQLVQDAITNKAKAEYRGAYFSKNDAEDMIKKADKFVVMAGEVVGSWS
ncbi:hypothetical protein HYU22_04505 [Candidatus Woesearchaeota archaeon]|nr:hypothetical protein [Candidatus Woesearchaeota archaeon]